VRMIPLVLALLMAAQPARAEVLSRESAHDVPATVARLEAAAEAAGARVFASVPHSAGAASIGESLPPMVLVIFGNPKIGTPAIHAAPHAGLVLPLRVLVHEDAAGVTRLSWEEPGAMLTAVGVPADAPVIAAIAKALDGLTAKAAAAE